MADNLSGLDSNILCYALDPAYPEHRNASILLKNANDGPILAISPTVIHETHHVLVYSQKIEREDASRRIFLLMRQNYVRFFNQTKTTTRNAIYLANKYQIGGRDSLILANYLCNGVSQIYTHDQDILRLEKVKIADKELRAIDPI